MKQEEILFLNQLIKSLEEAEKNLEKSYNKQNLDNFNKSKRVMIQIQKEISDMIK
jgi:hypothetical protein